MDKLITPNEAVKLAANEFGISLSKPTVIKFANDYKLGYQLGGKGGRWFIIVKRFREFIDGKNTKTN